MDAERFLLRIARSGGRTSFGLTISVMGAPKMEKPPGGGRAASEA